jgi:hypothetical protein
MKVVDAVQDIADRELIDNWLPRIRRVGKDGRVSIGMPHADQECLIIALKLQPGDKGPFQR